MNRWIEKIKKIFPFDIVSFREEILWRRSFKILFIQFAGLALGFIGNIFIARLYGGANYGVYTLVSGWAMLLAVIALWGMDDSHLVRLPAWKLNNQTKNIWAQLQWSLSVNCWTISATVLGFYLLVNYSHIKGFTDYAVNFNAGIGIIVLLTLYNNFINFLRGLDFVMTGELFDKFLRPILFTLLLWIFYKLFQLQTATGAIFANMAMLLLVVLMLYFLIRRFAQPQKESLPKDLFSASLSFNNRYVLLNVLYNLSGRIDLLVLGLIVSPVAIGHYNVGAKFAELSGFPIAVINLSLPTLMSKERHHAGEQFTPQILQRVAKNTFFQCLALGIFLLCAGHWMIGWYGQGFVAGYPVLCVLVLSNLLIAFTGSIDVFFILERQERKVIACRLISLSITIAFAWILQLWIGLTGVAWAMLTGNLVYVLLLEFLFYKRYGFITHPFSRRAS